MTDDEKAVKVGEATVTRSTERIGVEEMRRILGRKRVNLLAFVHALALLVAGRLLWALWSLDWPSITDNFQTLAILMLLRMNVVQGARLEHLEAGGLKVELHARIVPGPGMNLRPLSGKPPAGTPPARPN